MQGETLWTFETARYRVGLEALPEDDNPADSMDAELWETIAPKLESGDLWHFCARAYVEDIESGETLGEDYLGSCIYEGGGSFAREHVNMHPLQMRRRARKAIANARHEMETARRYRLEGKRRGYYSSRVASARRFRAEAAQLFKWSRETDDAKARGVCMGSYAPGMVHEAIREARQTLANYQGRREAAKA